MSTKQSVFDTVEDLVSDILYYDRKEDGDIPRGRIEEMIAAGEITVDEIVNRFRSNLEENI